MLSVEELSEIRKHLESAQNPLFLYDNDADGLCAFLIMQRYIKRGKGVAVKSYPEVSGRYLRRIEELKPDSIFVLDRAEISEDFLLGANMKNIPIIWIDHHKSSSKEEIRNQTFYYNSYPSSEPTTYIAQKACDRKEDLWLAMIGCISDVYKPEFGEEFERSYPELYDSSLSAFEALHKTEIGRFSLMLNFGLMNTITNVVKLMKYLFRANGPYSLLEENYHTREFHKRYKELNQELQKLIGKANRKEAYANKVLYFSYSGPTSMSAILSSRLVFEKPDCLIVVAHSKPEKINLSIRGKESLRLTNFIIKKIEGSTGGGHDEATGAKVPAGEEELLKKVLKEYEPEEEND